MSSKSVIVAKLLSRRNGATVAELSEATGWQSHSVRAFLSGLRKKGNVLIREARKDGASCYRLTTAAAHDPGGVVQAVVAADAPHVDA